MPTVADKARRIFAEYESSEDQIARLEQDARAFLGEENCPPTARSNNQEPGSEAWVKYEFLSRLRFIRAAIDRDESALVFHLALELGALLERFDVISAYKLDIIRGGKLAHNLQGARERANTERAADAAEEHAGWQHQAEEIWNRNRHLSKPAVAEIIAKRTDPPRSANTIRQIIKKPDEAR